MRKGIFKSINCDIICVCETHLAKDDVINVPGFSWFGFNRVDIHKNAPKPSGGIGILVKTWILEHYNASVIDRSFDGILRLQFENRMNDSNF